MGQIGYYLEFPYGTQNKAELTYEIPLLSLRGGPMVYAIDFDHEMEQGPTVLFPVIKSRKMMTFLKANQVLDFTSVFSSAFADKRTVGWAKVHARTEKETIDVLHLLNFQVTRFDRLGNAAPDLPEVMQVITLVPKQVA